jgi:Xaa-Pro aminopeptidase
MRYAPVNPELFAQNRKRLAAQLRPQSIAVFNSSDLMPTSADGSHCFVQHTDLFYLCGIDQADTILVIFPEAVEEKHREVLFVKRTDEKIAVWEGRQHSREAAGRVSDIATVYWTDEFESVFRPLVYQAETVYLNTNEHLRADVSVETRDRRFIDWCRTTFPLHCYARLAPLMHHLRAIKSETEIDLIRQAVTITAKAFLRILTFLKPGVWEFEVEAEVVYEFLKNRSRGSAFEPIVAAGANACVLHYVKNDGQCKNGDLLLLDFGAEYAHYAADVTRTLPVNGRYSSRQRQIYDAVLRIQRAAMDMLEPGNTIDAYHKAIGKRVESELVQLGLLKKTDLKNQDKKNPLYKKYFMHGVSHHLGLDVHDYGDRFRPFEAGMVLTCEPGIYVPDEGIGIRLENDILITGNGPVDLTADIPIEADEIETLMQQSL